ncbi:MAG TPA: VOC family protein [Candidatus Methanofastidiosa archaeon]|nr:VOC family protein [Candidatus Methanofastidiosa archaeon]
MAILNHIALRVSDLERSKKFYEDALGLRPKFEHGIDGGQFEKVSGIEGFDVVFAVMSDETTGVNIELVEFRNGFSEKTSEFNHIAFEVDDVDKLHSRMRDMGINCISEPVTIEHENDKINGKRMFYMRDPDGNVIEAFNKREGLYSG